MAFGLEVASLFAKLGLDDTQFNSKLGAADSKMKRFDTSLGGVASKWKDFGQQAAIAAIPIGLAMGKGINTAMNFESALAEISARTGVTGSNLDAVSDKARELGSTTQFMAQDAVQGMLELMASGDDLETAMGRIGDVLTLAAVGGVDLKTSADGLTDVMAAMRLEAGQSANTVDIMSRASASSSATITDMMQALASGGNTAANFGISIGDTAAIMAILAENSVKGSEAGTALRSMLLNMTRPTETVTNAWDDLGTSMFDSEGNVRNFNTVLLELDAALSTKSAEEQNRLMKDLAGSYGFTALSALLAADGITDMSATMRNQRDATTIAEARMNTFEGSVLKLKSAISDLEISVFTPFMNNTLSPFIDSVTDAALGVSDWADDNPELTDSILTMATGIGAGVAAISAFGVAAGLVKTGVIALVATAFNPLTAALALASVLTVAYVENWGGFRDFVDNSVRPALDSVARGFRGIQSAASDVETIIDGLNKGKWSLGDVLEAAGNAVVNEFSIKRDNSNEARVQRNTRTIDGDLYAKPNSTGSATVINTTVITGGRNGANIANDIHTSLNNHGVR